MRYLFIILLFCSVAYAEHRIFKMPKSSLCENELSNVVTNETYINAKRNSGSQNAPQPHDRWREIHIGTTTIVKGEMNETEYKTFKKDNPDATEITIIEARNIVNPPGVVVVYPTDTPKDLGEGGFAAPWIMAIIAFITGLIMLIYKRSKK